MDFSHISQELADIHVSAIMWFALALTIVRLVLIKIPNATSRAFAEVVEAALIAVVLVFMIIQPFVMKSFYIPSGSMLPTLVDDDHIVVNKLLYRFAPPHVEDVVVFVAPPQALALAPEGMPDADAGPTNYIKRMIGNEGDIIEARHGFITVNGAQYTHADIRGKLDIMDRDKEHVKIEPSDIRIYDTDSSKTYTADDIAKLWDLPGATVTFHPGQTIRNGQVLDEPYAAEDPAYDLKIVDGMSLIDDYEVGGGTRIDGSEPDGPQELAFRAMPAGPVPKGEIFVMGDNRNDSNDSTRWGPLNRSAVVGRASFIFYPFNRIRIIK